MSDASRAETRGPIRSRRADLVAAALLALAVVALYADVVFGGASIVYSDNFNPLDHRGLAANYGPGFVPVEELWRDNLEPLANLHDAGGALWQWEPFAVLLQRSLRDGALPWWDPYSGAGAPGLASLNPTPCFPPYLAMVALGNGTGLRNAYALLLQFASALATYVFLRRHSLRAPAALFGAVAWIACGAMAQNVASMIGQTIACVPFPLLASRLWLDRPDRRRGALLALVYATVALSTFPPVLVAGFACAGTYVLAALALRGGGARAFVRDGTAYAALCVLSLALVAFYYLPVARTIELADYLDGFYDQAWSEHVSPVNALQLWSSKLAGGAKLFSKPWMPPKDAPHELPYVGGTVLLAIAFASRRALDERGRLLLLWSAGLALLFAAKLVGLPPLDWLALLPILRSVHYVPYFGMVIAFLLIVVAATGLESVLAGETRRARIAVAAALALALATGSFRLAAARGVLAGEFADRWRAEWGFAIALLAATLVAIVLARAPRGSRRRVAAATVLCCGFAVEVARIHFQTRQPRWDVWRHPPAYVEVLRRATGEGRAMGFAALPPNVGSAYGIRQVDSEMTVSSPRLRELYLEASGSKSPLFVTDPRRLPGRPFLSRAAIRALAISAWAPRALAEARSRGYRELFQDGRNSVFEVDSPSRYVFTSSYRVVSAEAARRMTLEAPPRRTIFLEESPSFADRPNGEAEVPIEIAESGTDRYRLRLTSDTPGLVYMAESSMPGWSATVNGRAARILAANYAFRAVEVPAGESVVEMRYEPPGLRAGLALSGAGLAAIVILLLRKRARASD